LKLGMKILYLDSRFRGNDTRERRDSSLPGVWGCHPTPFFSPKIGGQGVEIETEDSLRAATCDSTKSRLKLII